MRTIAPPAGAATAFLLDYFDGLPEEGNLYVLLWALNDDDDKRSFWYRASDLERAGAFAATLTRQYRNVYFGVGL